MATRDARRGTLPFALCSQLFALCYNQPETRDPGLLTLRSRLYAPSRESRPGTRDTRQLLCSQPSALCSTLPSARNPRLETRDSLPFALRPLLLALRYWLDSWSYCCLPGVREGSWPLVKMNTRVRIKTTRLIAIQL